MYIIVTAAIIENNGKFLLTQRPLDKHNGGRWEFPGGKVEQDEKPEACLKREIKEELDIEITVNKPFEESAFTYVNTKQILLLAFHCTFVAGTIKKKDIADYIWVRPSEMEEMDITEADLPFVKKLLENGNRSIVSEGTWKKFKKKS